MITTSFITMKLSIKPLIVILLFSSHLSYAQAEEETVETEEFKRHKLTLFAGTSWIPEGRNVETNQKETTLAPTWGYAYEYWLGEKWAIASYGDIELVNIKVEDSDANLVERENVIVFTLGATYEILPKWTAYLGAGLETDPHETIAVARLTTEYALIESNGWEAAISGSYLLKDFYDVFSIGLVIGKRF